MELHGERLIPADVQHTWDALNDPEVLKSCIAGCETLERNGDNRFRVVIAVRVGPVSARFNGALELTEIDAPHGCTINFEGQGGAAGFGKGTSKVALEPSDDNTRLRYAAFAQVGGKLAQIGSRLVDATAAKMAGEFFSAFEARLRESATAGATAAAPAAAAEAPAAAPAVSAVGNRRMIQWAVAALVVAVAIYFILR